MTIAGNLPRTPPGQTELAALFADMAPGLGLSRPAGACFATIWRAAQAPCADDLVRDLGISRSNVSIALKELRQWGMVQIARTPGDRREFFVAPADPWALVRQIIAERQRRDLASALDRLYAIETLSQDPRISSLCEAVETVSGWMAGLSRLDSADLAQRLSDETPDTDEAKKKKKKKKA
ncbi:GbsR/MarR family transcriptional regulator [Phaeovulum sp. W22_SRMD_FR3]|uniref:GbsR/MarR family transcriptional regulator n=1 Tax=Phaeovulum sp. W22_SRMD_FR3 TaxID=3240274 RepID=UPI003F9A13F2